VGIRDGVDVAGVEPRPVTPDDILEPVAGLSGEVLGHPLDRAQSRFAGLAVDPRIVDRGAALVGVRASLAITRVA
jgi:hypothetical protein